MKNQIEDQTQHQEKTYVEVKGVRIGEGIPKICVPIVGKTQAEIFAAAKALQEIDLDIVEWRADWFDEVFDFCKVEETLIELRKILKNIPLLFTFRTAREGGEKEITDADYATLNQKAAASGKVDLLDVEAFREEKIVKEIIEAAHCHQVKVIASNHDFTKTPAKAELIDRMCKMQQFGADIAKIAVMPQNKADVLTLLAATQEMASVYAKGPIITMSMSGTGFISRICGEVFGSAVTFGAVGKASAPGQINATDLKQALILVHQGL